HHGERREAGVRLRDAGGQGPEPARQPEPCEPSWEPSAKKHRDSENRDCESKEHAQKTRHTDFDLSYGKGALEGTRPSLAARLYPAIDHELECYAVNRLQRSRGRYARCRSDDPD